MERLKLIFDILTSSFDIWLGFIVLVGVLTFFTVLAILPEILKNHISCKPKK